jgi:hypothetical protein
MTIVNLLLSLLNTLGLFSLFLLLISHHFVNFLLNLLKSTFEERCYFVGSGCHFLLGGLLETTTSAPLLVGVIIY